MRYLILSIIPLSWIMVLVLGSCKKEAVETHKNGEFEVELLFEHDGCRMYRFYDGKYIYWSDCRGATYATTKSNKTTVIEQTMTTGE